MYKGILFLSLMVCFLSSCYKDSPNEIACTEEFRMISIKVIGDSLSDFYTLRTSTNDTIRSENFFPEANWYPVVDDNFSSKLKNSQETFVFIGKINDSVVVRENFVISADECHINKVSGVEEVEL